MATKKIFDLSDIEQNLMTDDSIREFEYAEFPPINSTNLNTNGNKEIIIQQQDLITLPSEAYLYFEGDLTKSDGTAIPTADKNNVALINNAMMYLFERISYYINGEVVEEIERPGQTTTMLGLLKYTPDQSTSSGLSMCWLPDIDYDSTNNANSNMTLRSKFKKFSFNVPLNHIFGFMDDYNKILYGVRQSIRLKRLVDNDMIQVKTGVNKTDFSFSLDKLSLFMPIIKPSLETEIKLYEAIENKSVLTVLFRGRNTQTMVPPANSTNIDWSLQSTTGKPRYIIISFQKDNVKSKANFSNLKLNRIYVEVNTRRYPNQDIEVNYTEDKYSRIFKQTYDFKKKFYDTDDASSFSMITFKSLYPIYVIDISKHEDRTNMSALDIKIKAIFESAPGSGVEAFATIISDNEMNLESSGKRFVLLK